MKILDIGIITPKQEIFDDWVEVQYKQNASFWWIHDMHSVRGLKFDLILRIDLWTEVSDEVIEEAYSRLKHL